MKLFLLFLPLLMIAFAHCSSLFGDELRSLYPDIEPYQQGYLPVSGGHSLYWEECGNPNGVPIVFLHGGPGMGCVPYHRTFFDPERYRVVLFDQRGAGRSEPFSCLENNTTWDLVEDIELLRTHLGIEKWIVFGGSWGSTLGLTYAIKNPASVCGLILRGIFLCRPKEIQWFYQSGAHHIFPDLWEKYSGAIPEEERADFVEAYYRRLTSSDTQVRKDAAKAWSGWEGGTSKLHFNSDLYESFTEDVLADSIARIECHYFKHNTFFDSDNWILENIEKIRHVPCVIVQGRYDIPCPMVSAWELHRAWPEADFKIISDAGHAPTEAGITDALIRATDAFLLHNESYKE